MQGVSRKIESRTYAVGDEVKVIKKGSQTGKHGIILDPDWTGRCKVRMLDKKPDDKKAIKSYAPNDFNHILHLYEHFSKSLTTSRS